MYKSFQNINRKTINAGDNVFVWYALKINLTCIQGTANIRWSVQFYCHVDNRLRKSQFISYLFSLFPFFIFTAVQTGKVSSHFKRVVYIHNITPMKIWANMSKELHVPVEWSWYIMYIYTTLNPAKFVYPTKYIYKKSIPLISCSLKWLVPDQSIFQTSFNLLTCENAMVQLPLYFTLITPLTYWSCLWGNYL